MPSPTVALKPMLPELQMPLSAGPRLPSELPRSPLPRSPLPSSIGVIKREETDLKTPITPPTAYTDFLKALSPAVTTPLTATSMRSPFSFTDRTGHLTPLSSLPSSAGSVSSTDSNIKTTIVSAPLCPPTPFVRPSPVAPSRSARSPTMLRKLRIPPSPTTTTVTEASLSATPQTATPSSAVRSPFSPTSWYLDGKTKMWGAPPATSPRHISVRQVVTKTITYRPTALEPAPRGKRRRLE